MKNYKRIPNIDSEIKETVIGKKYTSLYKNLLNQCYSNSTESSNVQFKTRQISSVLYLAVESISDLERREKNLRREKAILKNTQITLLKKLITMLKGVKSSPQKTLESSFLSSKKNGVKERSEAQRNYFLGFRSKIPVLKDRHGYITIERLFCSSPPPSPVRSISREEPLEEEFPPALPAVPGELDFVFKPTRSTADSISATYLDKSLQREKLKGLLKGQSKSKVPKFSVKSNSNKNNRKKKVNRISKKKVARHASQIKKKTKKKLVVNGRTGVVKKEQTLTREEKLLMNPLSKVNFPTKSKSGRTIKFKKWNELDSKVLMNQTRKGAISKVDGAKLNKSKIPIIQKPNSPKLHSNSKTITTRKSLNSRDKIVNDSCEICVGDKDGTSTINLENQFPGFSSKGKNPRAKVETKIEPEPQSCPTIDSKKRGVKRKLLSNTDKAEVSSTQESINSPVSDNSQQPNIGFTKGFGVVNNNKRVQRVEPVVKSKDATLNTGNLVTGEKMEMERSRDLLPPSLDSELLYYPVHPFISHDLPVHFIPIDAKSIPNYIPLYTPLLGPKSNAPIYPSFVRTRSSNENGSPKKYVVSKGINSRSIPRRSYPAEEVKKKILAGVAPTPHCSLIPEVLPQRNNANRGSKYNSRKKNSSHVENATNAPPPINLLMTPTAARIPSTQGAPNLPITRSADAPSLINNGTLHKIHRCTKCSFVTPKLGVLKRHELCHSKSSPKDDVILIDPKSNSVNSKNNGKGNSPHPILLSDDEGTGIKIVESKSLKGCPEQENTFSGFTDSSVGYRKNLQTRFPSITFTPVYHTVN